MYERIALVKTGWSDDYQGGPVLGRHAHLQAYNEAHERFNFLRYVDGNYYGYLPPMGAKSRPPQPKTKSGWLLLFVSAKNGDGPLTVVGWYEDATLHEEYRSRPEYADSDFELDVHGKRYNYCLTSRKAHLISTPQRTVSVPGEHFKRTPILYVHGTGKNDRWRRDLARLAESLVANRVSSQRGAPSLAFPDAQHRKRVEAAAIESAKQLLLRKHYRLTDRQKDNCGYDLLAKHRKNGPELHVEVKGTSGSVMHFFMSRSEFQYMSSPQWRLIVVSDALGSAKPKLLTADEVRRTFSIDPFAWEGTAKL